MKHLVPIKHLTSFCALLASIGSLLAQNNLDAFEKYRQNMEDKFESAREKNEKEFASYRDKINKAFSDYLNKEWKSENLKSEDPVRPVPEPEPIIDNTPVSVSRPLPFQDSIVALKPMTKPKPVEPIQEIVTKPEEDDPTFAVKFSYLGNKCKVRMPRTREFTAPNGTNNEVSNAWKILSRENYNGMLVDCLCYRKALKLCDWAFYQFTRELTGAYWGNPDNNEAVITQMYILSQLGYKMRIGRANRQIVPLLAFEETIYSVPYYTENGCRLYCFNSNQKGMSMVIESCPFSFPEEKAFSLRIENMPAMPETLSEPKRFVSNKYPSANAKVSVNTTLMTFLDNYPFCRWDILAAASLSTPLKNQLYPSLRKAISGLSEVEAANVLIDFVQTAFSYKKDEEQFGREKSFFGDETFFYPYSDCEDRAILYSILVRDLLKLDVVLLDYPSHIATAVHFNKDVKGDYFMIDNKKYLICDPTYIGATIGKSMPEMINLKATIIKIK